MDAFENAKKENELRIEAMKRVLSENEKENYHGLQSENIVERIRAVKMIIRKTMNKTLLDLARQVFDYYEDLPYKKLELAAQVYFMEKYGTSLRNIEFIIKKSEATQIGRLIVINVGNQEQFQKQKFHAKTHRHGAIIGSTLTRSGRFDPKELFVYSLLYLLGLGPEVHFFGLNACDFYICTRDVLRFTTCDTIKELIQDKSSPEFVKLCNELLKLDVVSRILTLTDTTPNKGNFAFTYFSPSRFKLMVFDFAVDNKEFYENPKLVDSFMAGNGLFNYGFNDDPLLKYALLERDAKERKKKALEYLKTLQFQQKLEESNNQIESILESSIVTELKENEKQIMKNDFLNYKNGIYSNFQLFLNS